MNSYLIEEKSAGQYGSSTIRVVKGTDVTISKGMLQVWNSLPNGKRAHPVASIAIERLVTFKIRTPEKSWDGTERRAQPVLNWDGIDRRGRGWDGSGLRAA